MLNENLLGGLFQQKNTPPEKDHKKKPTLLVTFYIVFFFLLYPFVLSGMLLYLVIKGIEKKQKKENIGDLEYRSIVQKGTYIFGSIGGLVSLLNLLFFIFVLPRGYLSCYLFFPLNWMNTALIVNYQTLLALIFGGFGMGNIMLFTNSFINKRKIISKEEQMKVIRNSKEYQERVKNKYEISKQSAIRYAKEYAEAREKNDKKLLEFMSQRILLGVNEFGNDYFITVEELNQHAIFCGTTGSGKTVALTDIVEHCAKFDIPCLFFDGKGARSTQDAINEIVIKSGKKLKVFSDKDDVRYNPVKNGNSVAVRDRLVKLAETESVYYSGASKSLLMGTVQLLDAFSINKDLKNLLKYFMPMDVLSLFYEEINNTPVENTDKKSMKFKQFEQDNLFTESTQVSHKGDKKSSSSEPSYEDLYKKIKKKKTKLSEKKQKMFNQLFERYEHKREGFLYLYTTADSLQTNIGMLLDSEIGYLFDTSEGAEELDLMDISRKNEIAYISLDGLVYEEFIQTLSHFIVSDINYMASEKYAITEDFPFVIIFDECGTYLTENMIDTVNKTRGAGVHAIFSPQTLADIKKTDENLLEMLIGNVNTFVVGQTNSPVEVEYWSKLFGTYEDIEVTSMIEQQEGFSDVNKTDWVAERGTKRNVDKFKIHPDTIKALRKSEFVIGRKANDVREKECIVYARKPV